MVSPSYVNHTRTQHFLPLWLLLLTTTSTHTQRTPKPAEHPNNLLTVPSCCWYVAWSCCREITTQCPAASLGQTDEVKQTQLALQWLMLFSTPPDTLTWQTRMNIIHPLRSPMTFRRALVISQLTNTKISYSIFQVVWRQAHTSGEQLSTWDWG